MSTKKSSFVGTLYVRESLFDYEMCHFPSHQIIMRGQDSRFSSRSSQDSSGITFDFFYINDVDATIIFVGMLTMQKFCVWLWLIFGNALSRLIKIRFRYTSWLMCVIEILRVLSTHVIWNSIIALKMQKDWVVIQVSTYRGDGHLLTLMQRNRNLCAMSTSETKSCKINAWSLEKYKFCQLNPNSRY